MDASDSIRVHWRSFAVAVHRRLALIRGSN